MKRLLIFKEKIKMVRQIKLLVVGTTLFTLSGCANMPEFMKDEEVQGGVIGLSTCATGVYYWTGGNKIATAIAGSACGVIGAIGGKLLKERRKEYASAENFYDGEIAKAHQFNEEKVAYKKQLTADIRALETETQKIVSLQKKGKASKKVLDEQKRAIANKQAEVKTALKKMKDEFEFQNALYAEIQKKDPKAPRLADLQKEVKILQVAITEVDKQQSQLANLDDDFV